MPYGSSKEGFRGFVEPNLTGSGNIKNVNVMNIEVQTIQSKLYTLRGQVVMLDRDLAEMYGVETRVLKQAVRRNIFRFPVDFMFEILAVEMDAMVSQNVIPGKGVFGGALPFAFTEQGVAMLSSVLKSRTAIEINIAIMRAFVAVRQLVVNRPADRVGELRQYVEEMFAGQNDINEDTRAQLELINQTLAEMQAANKKNSGMRRQIGFGAPG